MGMLNNSKQIFLKATIICFRCFCQLYSAPSPFMNDSKAKGEKLPLSQYTDLARLRYTICGC